MKKETFRGVAQSGRVRVLGTRSWRFEFSHPDFYKMKTIFILTVLLAAPPVKVPDSFIIKNISNLQVGESSWISKSAIVVDMQKHMWVNISHPLQEYATDLESSYRLLHITKCSEGYQVLLPRIHYECKQPWISGPKYFRWKLETIPVEGNSIYALKHWEPIIKFQVYPKKEKNDSKK